MLGSGALLWVQAGGDGAAGGPWMRHGAAGLGKVVAFNVCRDGGAAELVGRWFEGSSPLAMGCPLAGAWGLLGRLSPRRWKRSLQKQLCGHCLLVP